MRFKNHFCGRVREFFFFVIFVRVECLLMRVVRKYSEPSKNDVSLEIELIRRVRCVGLVLFLFNKPPPLCNHPRPLFPSNLQSSLPLACCAKPCYTTMFDAERAMF